MWGGGSISQTLVARGQDDNAMMVLYSPDLDETTDVRWMYEERNKNVPLHRYANGGKVGQELELGIEEISNSITSVQRDALVEVKPLLVGGLVEEKTFGTQYHQQERVYSTDAIGMAHPAQIPGGSYKYAIKERCGIRIRRLTPKECFRLMNFSDADHEASAAVNSESQRYKQAGNSIVVSVLMALFSQMGIGKKPWNEMTEQERQELVFPTGYITKQQGAKR